MRSTVKTDAIAAAEQAMGTEADAHVNVKAEYRHPTSRDGSCFNRHVAIEWEGGVLWLDMSQQSDHFCIDVRQFVAPAEGSDVGAYLAGQGVFTIVNGRRQQLASVGNDVNVDPLEDPDGTPVVGHGWNGGYVVTLMHDKVPGENQTNRAPCAGRG